MEQKFEGISAEIEARKSLVLQVLAGETSDDVPGKKEEGFSGVVLDGNKDTFVEVVQIGGFLEELLRSGLNEAIVAATLESTDGKTKVEIFGTALGVDNNDYLSRWHNKGEKPTYILWPKEMYDSQLVGDDEQESPFRIAGGEWE